MKCQCSMDVIGSAFDLYYCLGALTNNFCLYFHTYEWQKLIESVACMKCSDTALMNSIE